MKNKNRIKRLSAILELLNKGNILSTPYLAKKFNTTKKIIQTDFKEYILPLFEDKIIYYDYSLKAYTCKHSFLSRTLLSAEDLAVISMLLNKSRDKYSDNTLFDKAKMLFKNYEDALSHSIYQLGDIEKINKFKKEIIRIQHAITNKNIISCIYRDKKRELYPLQIRNFDGFWYLICYDTNYKEIRKYHLNSLTHIQEGEKYEFGMKITEKFDNAINAYYKPQAKQIQVQLFLDKMIAKYFKRKPLSRNQRIVKEYDDGSCDMEIHITDYMEIIPTIQRFLPYIKVIEPANLQEEIHKNIKKYLSD